LTEPGRGPTIGPLQSNESMLPLSGMPVGDRVGGVDLQELSATVGADQPGTASESRASSANSAQGVHARVIPGIAPFPNPSVSAPLRMNWRRFFAVSNHWFARSARKTRKVLRQFTLPAPRWIVRPILLVLVSIRAVYYWLLQTLICEPWFKAYCESYGKNVHTGPYLHWIQGNGAIVLGDNVLVDGKCSIAFAARFAERPRLTIGHNTRISHGCSFVIGKAITIGSYCMIPSGTQMFDSNGHSVDAKRRLRGEPPSEQEVRPIVIHDNVWIGKNSIIGPGVTVGEGAVISSGSVVLSDVAAYTVVGGNPAGKIGVVRAE
jgi:carbonic anhydrase/acetyltransferase-like protein (isoleucine patch superfamily)